MSGKGKKAKKAKPGEEEEEEEGDDVASDDDEAPSGMGGMAMGGRPWRQATAVCRYARGGGGGEASLEAGCFQCARG